ncbi:MAG TPA: sigma-70 family RNA polymerase sigma factor [Bryobacteraceae bacterium]|nr:sigma-70 family RNA polymerase sigma factor [Bryobacteraceae bacterium]
MDERQKRDNFDQLVVPHLAAAYNLARWLTRNQHDAEDVAQESMLRAYRFFDGFRAGDARAWLLAIVRNTSNTWLERNRKNVPSSAEDLDDAAGTLPDPETLAIEKVERETLRLAIEALPIEFRETLVLREIESLSYKEIAAITEVPMGTVMSRLARARDRLARALSGSTRGGAA